MSRPYYFLVKSLPFNYSHKNLMKSLFKWELEDVKLKLVLNNDYYNQTSKDILIEF